MMPMENNSNSIIIKQATIVDSTSPFNGQVKDILIENDQIIEISDAINPRGSAEIIEANDLHVSPGWFDIRVNFNDPGHEEKEDLESGVNAAIYGGFTAVGLSPETTPPINSKADIEYLYQKSEELPVNVYPLGAISKGLKGNELSEMHDMHQSGAVGFSHGKVPLSNSALMKLALQYNREIAPPLHVLSTDLNLGQGHMHEGEVSTLLGLKGIPDLAEEVQILRDLHLAKYAEASVHFMGISSSSSLEVLKTAKEKGNHFTSDVALANLYFSDADLKEYDSNLKVMPPIRSEKDRMALIDALKEGLIDVITSDHTPQNIESKKCEFDMASFGMIGLESFFGALLKALDNQIELEKIIDLIAINPRKILNLPIPSIEVGSWAEMTLFNPGLEWIFSKEDIQSRSQNTPFIGQELKGKALGIVNKGYVVWMD